MFNIHLRLLSYFPCCLHAKLMSMFQRFISLFLLIFKNQITTIFTSVMKKLYSHASFTQSTIELNGSLGLLITTIIFAFSPFGLSYNTDLDLVGSRDSIIRMKGSSKNMNDFIFVQGIAGISSTSLVCDVSKNHYIQKQSISSDDLI